MRTLQLTALLAIAASTALSAQGANPLSPQIDRLTQEITPQVVTWRRDFHQNPELGNRETRTAKVIADELRRLGYEVKTGVAHTGVVAVLKGGKPGPVVALRADMDALPVTEQGDLPFKSTAKSTFNGQQVGVMHACGHDNHMAILLGAATIFARMRDQLPGSIKLIFQPAEEGPPAGEQGGADLMVKEGVLDNPKVDAIFGLHVFPNQVGTIEYRSGPLMASGDGFTIKITGRQTHGAMPWAGVDPIVIGAQIVMSLQTIVSRTVNITEAPAVLTIGAFNGGNRFNIVPETVELLGTLRTFDEGVRKDVQRRMQDIVTKTAEMAGGKAEIAYNIGYPVTVNDPALTDRMAATIKRVAGVDNVRVGALTGTSEDFSYYQHKVPGLFFFLGVTPKDRDPKTVPTNHSPLFYADESALPIGVRALTNLALDYLFTK
jgi:amidohydrolase